MKTKEKDAPRGFRMTPQRSEIIRLLDGNRTHPSAEEIYRAVKKKFSGISFATVYNTLQSLLSMGGVAELGIDAARKRFDPCTSRHSHLMCVKCGRIDDVKAPARPLKPSGKPAGFRILHCNIEFYGVCPACGKKTGSKEDIKCQKKKKK
jgi:Fur family peroxide stress response transcriptional regulator